MRETESGRRSENEPQDSHVDIFPGQGFAPDALVKTARNFLFSRKARQVYVMADEILGNIFPGNRTFRDLIYNGTDEGIKQLIETENAQPASLIVSMAAVAAHEQFGEDFGMALPIGTTGHSAGFTAGAWRSESLTAEHALLTARIRGEVMRDVKQARGEAGRMAVIRSRAELDREKIVGICNENGLFLANINSTKQIVICGREGKIVAGQGLNWGGPTYDLLETSDGFHHPELMAPVVDLFAERLDKTGIKFNNTRIPLYRNSDGSALTRGEDVKRAIVEDVARPVEFVRVMKLAKKAGANSWREYGNARTLTNFVRDLYPKTKLANINSAEAAGYNPPRAETLY